LPTYSINLISDLQKSTHQGIITLRNFNHYKKCDKEKDRKRKYKKAVKNLPDNNDQMIAWDEFVEVTFDKTFNQGCGAGAGAAGPL